jgi:sugar phosphate permease
MDLAAADIPAAGPSEARAPQPQRATRGERWACAVLAAAALAVLGLAAWLEPSPSGIGTHRALGLAPCGWVQSMSLPCPSCGMTTAFALAARGRFVAAAAAQPMGFLLAVGSAAAAIACLHTALTGSRLAHVLGARLTPRVLLGLGIVALLAWGWKIASYRGLLPVAGAHA